MPKLTIVLTPEELKGLKRMAKRDHRPTAMQVAHIVGQYCLPEREPDWTESPTGNLSGYTGHIGAISGSPYPLQVDHPLQLQPNGEATSNFPKDHGEPL